MTKAEKYINLISEMYSLSDKIVDKISNNADLIDKELEHYIWDDVKFAIEKYYTYKNDKTYPKLCHILAILNTSGKRIEPQDPIPDIQPPYTNIREIQDIFMKVCEILHVDGIFCDDYFGKVKNLRQGNKTFITKDGKIWNKKWIWDDAVDRLKRNFPQEWNKFRHLTTTEKYALAYKLGCYNAKD